MRMTYDTVIYNAEIIDGSGAMGYPADLAVKNGRIVKIGRLGHHAAGYEIDAAGSVLTPGFIDSHSHADLALLAAGLENEKLKMGVTAEVIGQCGFSPFPITPGYKALRRQSMSGFLPGVELPWTWSDLAEYKKTAHKKGLTHHVVPLAGQGSLRQAVMGDSPDKPTVAQMDKMRFLADTVMKQGAYGLSSGLIYSPGVFSETEELIELCRIVADNGGLYVTHIRGETAPLVDAAVDEALTVSREAGLPLEISHLKVIGLDSRGRGKINGILDKIEIARLNGLKVDFDCYPYTRGSTYLNSLIPKWAHEGGVPGLLSKLKSPKWRNKIRSSIEADDYGGENWLMACGFEVVRIGSMTHKDYKPFVGQDLDRISVETAKDPYDLLFDILLAEQAGTIMVFSMMRSEDMKTALTHPLAMIGTDAIPCPPGQGRPHPRGYGTFPKILGRLARDQGLFTLEEAVCKMTCMPATKLGLKDKGRIAEGMYADLVIFDRYNIMDQADYQNPRKPPTGISHVLVEGITVLKNGRLTGLKAGRFL